MRENKTSENKARTNQIGSIKKAHRRHNLKAASKYLLGALAIVMILTAGVKVSYDLNGYNSVSTNPQSVNVETDAAA